MTERRFIPRVIVILFCTMLQICFGTVYAWSFFQTLLVKQLGWSFIETAAAFSIAIFSLGLSAAWAGAMLPRLGPRKLALAGSVMFSGGYLIAGLALHLDAIILFYLGYGVIGGAGIGLGYVTPVATVAKWFPDRKGLATGIVVMGFGVGALLLSKVLAPVLMLTTQGELPLLFAWLGIVFACVLIPSSLALRNPPAAATEALAGSGDAATAPAEADEPDSVSGCLRSREFTVMWLVFFFNIAAGISIISFQSPLLQDVWGLADPSVEPATLAEYGATLIAVSSLCNGAGRLFWGLLSDRIGRVRVFRILLASQMVVFGILMTERDPWIFSALVCYILLCFGGGIRDDAVLRFRCLRHEEDVGYLRGDSHRLGGGGNLRPALRGVSEGWISRPGHHLLLPDRGPDPWCRVYGLLSAERRAPPTRPADGGGDAPPARHRASRAKVRAWLPLGPRPRG